MKIFNKEWSDTTVIFTMYTMADAIYRYLSFISEKNLKDEFRAKSFNDQYTLRRVKKIIANGLEVSQDIRDSESIQWVANIFKDYPEQKPQQIKDDKKFKSVFKHARKKPRKG